MQLLGLLVAAELGLVMQEEERQRKEKEDAKKAPAADERMKSSKRM